jgi:3-methyladenine DNA glycosylase AlkD
MPPKPPDTADAVLAWMKKHGSKATRDGMARYGLPTEKVFGITMSQLKALAKLVGRNHDLATGLWATGLYDARMAAALIDDPAEVTSAQMDRWCREFDNWGVVDTVCFALFDRTPHAWAKVSRWAPKKPEFERRAAFALLWGLTVHDKAASDANYLEGLRLIEQAATDDRHYVKKAVNMALRAVGKRNAALNAAAIVVAQRLSDSDDATASWIGRDALRELRGPVVARRISR